jgi:rubrerythrin
MIKSQNIHHRENGGTMSKTMDDLQAGFAGESQANRKYLAFAKKADQEGYPQVAKLFRAAAAAETVHAQNHFRAMDGVKSTEENLKAAIAGEHYESVDMYPEFIKDAEAENAKRALVSFNYALEVEKVHEGLYQKALDTLKEPQKEVEYYVCPICGYTHEGKEPPERCPVCGAPAAKFEKID